MPRYLTNSEMKEFQKCQRKWYLGSFLGLQKKGQDNFNKPLGIGNRVHDALAAYYTPDVTEAMHPLDHIALTEKRDTEVHPQHSIAIAKECELARIMLEGYIDWLAETGEDQALTVLEAERASSVRLFSEEQKDQMGIIKDWRLLTKLDALVRHDEFDDDAVLEHKTTVSLDALSPELRINTQALTEHLVRFMTALEKGEEPRVYGVIFNMLKKVKRTTRANPPFFKRIYVHHTKSELRHHWMHVAVIARQIEESEEQLLAGTPHQLVVPPNPSNDCHWYCPFFNLCPMMDNDADDSDGYIRDHFQVGDPLARYEGLLDD